MKNILIIAISLLSINQAIGQESAEKIMLNNFFELYKSSPVKAMQYLYPKTIWENRDEIKLIEKTLKQYKGVAGEYYGEELLYKKKLGESLITYVYLIKYETKPLKFTIEFYKPKDKWIAISFVFDSDFDDYLTSEK